MPPKRASWWTMALSGIATASLAAAPTHAQPDAALADAGVEPFSGHYVAEWKDITVGTSDLKLERDALSGQYHYKWTISARGIFRLVYSDDVTQESWFGIVDGHIRPDRYRASEGSATAMRAAHRKASRSTWSSNKELRISCRSRSRPCWI